MSRDYHTLTENCIISRSQTHLSLAPCTLGGAQSLSQGRWELVWDLYAACERLIGSVVRTCVVNSHKSTQFLAKLSLVDFQNDYVHKQIGDCRDDGGEAKVD